MPVVLVGHWVAGAGSSQNGLVLVVLASLVLFELVQLKVVVGKRRETTLKQSPHHDFTSVEDRPESEGS